MKMISIITLGVREIQKAAEFYEALGFDRSEKSDDNIVWFRTGSTVLGLYLWDALADDVGMPPGGSGFRGITLALNMSSKNDVDNMIERVRSLGAFIIKEPQDVFWGGYSSYFRDVDGHLWEVAWNPFTEVDEEGRLSL
ncbi:MAG: VOC family protein [Methanomassiliicoccales archaeon]|nr:VOC family protein [Methanomassiliicoccales archaeon]NYT15308.1 VOC family protein [Methanomassiliicoccales archaeon]